MQQCDSDAIVCRHEGSKKKKQAVAAPASSATGTSGAVKRADRLWRFDWSVTEGGKRQQTDSILDAQVGVEKFCEMQQKASWMLRLVF